MCLEMPSCMFEFMFALLCLLQKDSASRRQSVESTDLPIMKVSAEKLEALENQRRNSRQMRRASLADVIPDWPTLQHRIKEKEVHTMFPTIIPISSSIYLNIFQYAK